MQKFQDLLTEAAQLKQEQLKQERKNFEALPEYLKSGLNYAKKYVQLRKQHYLVQKYISQKLKTEGNDQYLLENYAQALSKYQQALSVFRFIHAKKYENLKDEDIIYQNYKPDPKFKQEHESHLVVLYLNICSALTKMNKKDEAVHSSEQALKINESNPKIYYKKAQAYLQYINRQSTDIKVGFYYLNKAFELSKDQSILVQMHKIKKELEDEREKEKKWFKFMFDKNNHTKEQDKVSENVSKQRIGLVESDPQTKQNKDAKASEKPKDSKQNQSKKNILDTKVSDFFEQAKTTHKIQPSTNTADQDQSFNSLRMSKDMKSNRLKEQFQKFRQENQNQQVTSITQVQKFQKTKISLKPYLIIPRDDRWLVKYQEDYIQKHGSKIYSILQLYNYSEYLIEFKSLLVKCLELKHAKITPQRDENKLLQEKITIYQKFVDWVKKHPVQKYKRYIERYQLQTKWIQQNRGRSLDQVYSKEFQKNKKILTGDKVQAGLTQFLDSVRLCNLNQKQQSDLQILQKEEETKKKTEMIKDGKNKTTNKKYCGNGFKEEWQYSNQQGCRSNNDEVSSNLKGFLQNYEDFLTSQQKLRESKKSNTKSKGLIQKQKTKHSPKSMQQEMQSIKENPFSFIKTLIIVLAITLLGKLIF